MRKLLAVLCWLLLAGVALAQGPPADAPAACARCHVEAMSQPTTSMAHALEAVDKCGVLLEHPDITATIGKFTYHIKTAGAESLYSVTAGTETVTMKIAWAMGASFALGQTYILEKDGQMYESRVSWFRELNGLGITLGDERTTPADLTQAAGRQIHMNEERRCFGCHATNAVQGRELTLDKLSPGVQCAHCHEGVDAHLAAASAGNHDLAPPPDLHKLIAQSADQTSSFCGQCHRTYAEIAMQPNQGIFNVRFQPYRLTGSKCYDPEDARIGCLACHNPHRDFNPQRANFDSRCLNCHGGIKAARQARARQARARQASPAQSPVLSRKKSALPATCQSWNCQAHTSSSPIIGFASSSPTSPIPASMIEVGREVKTPVIA